MYQVSLKEAETRLAELIETAARGEEVAIARSHGTLFTHCTAKSSSSNPQIWQH